MPWRNLKRFLSKFFKQPLYAISVLLKRARAYLAYSFRAGRSSLPEAITLFLTHRCNLHCKMCGQWGEGGVTKKESSDYIRQELGINELKNFIDGICTFTPNITLFGGEPLLHPSCIELIQYIKSKKMHCLMITNGSLLIDKAGMLVDAGLDELNVSLDGGQSLHDQIREMPGLFKKITAGLQAINDYKKEKGLNKPFINLQCTITKYNYKHLEQLLEVAKSIKADSLTYHNLIFLNQDLIDKQKLYDKALKSSSRDWEGFVFEPEIDPDVLDAKIKDISSKNYPFSVDFYPNFSAKGLKEYYDNPSYLPCEYPARCLSPWIVAYVFPDGEVRPCLNFTYSYGNIKDGSFTKIWNSEKAIQFRKQLKTNKVFPVCVRCTELYRY